MFGILLPNKSLGSTWNKMHCGIQDGDFSFRRSVSIYLSLQLVNQNVIQSMLKREQANCTLSLDERNHQIIKKLTQNLSTCFDQKTHKFQKAYGRMNKNGWGLTEKKTKCSESFVENSRIGETCNTPWGSERITSKQTTWKHMRPVKSVKEIL